MKTQQAKLTAAADLPRRQAAEEIAAALRTVMAEIPGIDRGAAQNVIVACESIAYAPSGGDDARVDPALVERAKRVVEAAAK